MRGDLDAVADAEVADLALEHREADPQGRAVGDRERGVAGFDRLAARHVDRDHVARDRGEQGHATEVLVWPVAVEGVHALTGRSQLGGRARRCLRRQLEGPLRGDALAEQQRGALGVGDGITRPRLDHGHVRLGRAQLGAVEDGQDIAHLDPGSLDGAHLPDAARDARADRGDAAFVELEHAHHVELRGDLGERDLVGAHADAVGEAR